MPLYIDLTNPGAYGFKMTGPYYYGVGRSVSNAGDINGDGYDDVIVGAPNSTKTYVVFGKAGGFVDLVLEDLALPDGFIINGEGSQQAGFSVSGAGDVNGDGYDDLIVGVPDGNDGGGQAGEAYVIFGKASGFGTINLPALGAADGFAIQGDASRDQAGYSVSSAGDVNGDGYDDIIVGAPFASNGSGPGKAYVIFGKASGFGRIDLTNFAPADGFVIVGDAAGDQAGKSVSSAGDINGDGYDDLIVGADFGDNGGTDAGEAYVLFGKASGFGTINLSTLAPADGFTIQGDAAGDRTGYSVSSAGDVNGDGYDDLIVGAVVKAAAYVVFGKAGGFSNIDLTSLGGADGFVLLGASSTVSVSDAGDFNGDGIGDLIVGSPGASLNGPRGGVAYLVYGRTTGFGTVDLANLPESDGFAMFGGGGPMLRSDQVGYSVSAAGDVDNDGYDDIIIGAPGDDQGAIVIFGFAYNIGTAGNDTLQGTPRPDQISGLDGNDVLLGLASNDELDGGAGDDVLDGGTGNDQMTGGTGNDAFYVDSGGDQVIEEAGGGNDTVFASASYTLAPDSHVETLAVANATTDVNLTGNGFANDLYGDARANFLDGAGGADRMFGGLGDDSYRVDNAGDVVAEEVDQGLDRIFTTVSYALAGNSHVEILSTNDYGASTPIDLTGNDFANELYASSGANVLVGGGGADIMWGFGGDDRYSVDNAGDVVVEEAGGGFDRIFTSVSYDLTLYSEVEILSTENYASTAAINLTGSRIDNQLYGNAGNNVLIGGGGADTMFAFGGDDWYYVDNLGDVVVEEAGGGFDRVFSSVSYALAGNSHAEILSTDDYGSTAAINLTGSFIDNQLYANAGNNVLIGGAGADTMFGFGGDDWYYVDNAGDVIVEEAGGGTDTVFTSISYALTLNSHAEALSTDNPGSTLVLDLAGSFFDNQIYGNEGANRIDGRGGYDILFGYGASDIFTFTSEVNGSHFARIGDFQPGVDKIALDDAAFNGLATGALNPNAFRIGTAQDADDRVLYDQASGILYFDADGNGAGTAFAFASLQGAPNLSASDFVVI